MISPGESPGYQLVKDAGWSIDRRVDVTTLISKVASVGFDVFDEAARFLESFWKLRVEHPPSIIINGRQIFCWTEFDPEKVCTGRDARVASRCAEVVGMPLCPVGTDGFHLTIYIAPDGAFFAGVDSTVFAYAQNLNGLLEKLADGSRPARIGEWEI